MNYINKFLSQIVYAIFLLLIFIFSYYSYLHEKEYLYKQVDHNILSIAKSSPMLLANDFHDRASSSSSISDEEFKNNMKLLSQIAKSFQVDYIYTCIRKNGTMYITSANATDEEYLSGNNLVHYFDPYVEATPDMLKIFDTGKILFIENTDHWGTFRNVLVPMKSPNGTTYIAGVSISLNDIQREVKERFIQHSLFGLGLILISLPIFLWRHRKIAKLAYYDTLTKLPNRLAFKTLSVNALNLSKRNRNSFALMFMDLDGFKMINDTLGHNVGDKLLVKVSKRLKKVLRESDIPSRQGGDEFVIALPNTNTEGASMVATKILEEISKLYLIDDHSLNVTCSIGIALFPDDGTDIEDLGKKADSAMYEAKNNGRNCFSIYRS